MTAIANRDEPVPPLPPDVDEDGRARLAAAARGRRHVHLSALSKIGMVIELLSVAAARRGCDWRTLAEENGESGTGIVSDDGVVPASLRLALRLITNDDYARVALHYRVSGRTARRAFIAYFHHIVSHSLCFTNSLVQGTTRRRLCSLLLHMITSRRPPRQSIVLFEVFLQRRTIDTQAHNKTSCRRQFGCSSASQAFFGPTTRSGASARHRG